MRFEFRQLVNNGDYDSDNDDDNNDNGKDDNNDDDDGKDYNNNDSDNDNDNDTIDAVERSDTVNQSFELPFAWKVVFATVVSFLMKLIPTVVVAHFERHWKCKICFHSFSLVLPSWLSLMQNKICLLNLP